MAGRTCQRAFFLPAFFEGCIAFKSSIRYPCAHMPTDHSSSQQNDSAGAGSGDPAQATQSRQAQSRETEARQIQSRQAWIGVFKEQRKKQFRFARSKAWRALRHSFQPLVLFLIRNLWVLILLAVLLLICLLLASHVIPGLAPEKVAPVTIQQSAIAPESHLKGTLIPPLSVWEDEGGAPSGQELDIDLENDGDVEGDFNGSLSASPGNCVHIDPWERYEDLRAHQTVRLPIFVDTSDCKVPVEISFRFQYQWTLLRVPGKHGRHSPPDANPTDSVQVPASCSGPNPTQLNLSIQLPPTRRYYGGKAELPERHYAGSLTTSPIIVTSAFAASAQRALVLLAAIAKEFTWPLLIAFLTIVGQNALARRSERQQI